jgi:hypothetical protein
MDVTGHLKTHSFASLPFDRFAFIGKDMRNIAENMLRGAYSFVEQKHKGVKLSQVRVTLY